KEDLVEKKAEGAMKTQSKSAETLSVQVFGDSSVNVSFPSHSSREMQKSSSVPMEQTGSRMSSNMIPTFIPQTQAARAQVRQQVNPPLTPNPSAATESIGNSKTVTPIISNTLSSMQHIIEEVEKEENEKKREQNQLAQMSSNDSVVRTIQDKSEHAVKLTEGNANAHELAIVAPISSGISGHVFEVVDKNTNVKYALKVFKVILFFIFYFFLQKGFINPEKKDRIISILHNELNILQILSGLNGVIKLHNYDMKEDRGYLLTELAHRDLFSFVYKEGFFFIIICKEKTKTFCNVKLIIRQLLITLEQMHQLNIVHRDIKPENIVFVQTKKENNGNDDGEIKFIDFGDAICVQDNEIYKHLVGTPCYLAPERFRQHRGWELKASDLWSIGVLLFETYTGKRCFYAPTNEALKHRIQRGNWSIPHGHEPSFLCQHFISALLSLNPEKRPSAKFALKHPWLVTNAKLLEKSLFEWNYLNDNPPKWATYVP
ncbi:hypothetical protein RFI_02268, partial [Reticulomyxa filosa]